jgi:ATP phosphoribosyltransferase regulatory subunit
MVAALTDNEHAEGLGRLMKLSGSREIIESARTLVSNEKSQAALDHLQSIFEVATALDIDRYIDIDLGDVGGLDYYTGLTFHIYVPNLGVAVGAGGRYDQLIRNFGRSEPAVGFSLCLDWLAQLLGKTKSGQARVLASENVILNSTDDLASTFLEAKRLRLAGKAIEIKAEAKGQD